MASDEETERFLQFSTDLAASSWRYKYLLNYIMHKKKMNISLAKWKVGDSFLFSLSQYRQLLRDAGFNLAAHDLNVLDIGQGRLLDPAQFFVKSMKILWPNLTAWERFGHSFEERGKSNTN